MFLFKKRRQQSKYIEVATGSIESYMNNPDMVAQMEAKLGPTDNDEDLFYKFIIWLSDPETKINWIR